MSPHSLPQPTHADATPDHRSISRRSLALGSAWTVPTIALAAQAPAYASSACTPASKSIIDTKFAEAANLYRCNGTKPTLEIEFLQSSSLANGGAISTWINVRNLSTCSITFTAQNPLRLRIQVLSTETVNSRRAVTMATSWGTSTVTPLGGTARTVGGATWRSPAQPPP